MTLLNNQSLDEDQFAATDSDIEEENFEFNIIDQDEDRDDFVEFF